jgi:spore maturation protein CgeB
MRSALAEVLNDAGLAAYLSRTGLRTVMNKHTCRHRVQELLSIVNDLDGARQASRITPQQERIAS